jgi:hypothetical protein
MSFCGALLLLAPALVAAQDPVPAPAPKQNIVTIRAVNGTFELKGASTPDLVVFTERCESKPGYSESYSDARAQPSWVYLSSCSQLLHGTT